MEYESPVFPTNIISLTVSLLILSETENSAIEVIIESFIADSDICISFITEFLVFDVTSHDQNPSISSLLIKTLLIKNENDNWHTNAFNCDVLFTMLVASESKNRDIQQIKDISDFFIRELKQREIENKMNIENKEANANHEGADSVLPEAQKLVLVHGSLHGSCNGAK